MAEPERTKAISWQCRHLYPVQIVNEPGGERRARCFGCGVLGPPRTHVAAARRALRESFSVEEGISQQPGLQEKEDTPWPKRTNQ
jgi:hypothetical protein